MEDDLCQGWNDFRYFERGLFTGSGALLTAPDAGNVSTGTLGGCTGERAATITPAKDGRYGSRDDPTPPTHWDNVNTRLWDWDHPAPTQALSVTGNADPKWICHGGGVPAIPGYSNVSTAPTD
jgi:hypothetical protein